MDIDKYLIPEFDFSRLDPDEFEADPVITREELIQVFKDQRSTWGPQKDYPLQNNRWTCFGVSQRWRCFLLLITIDHDGKYVFISFNLLEYGTGLL